MTKRFLQGLMACALAICMALPVSADIKIKTRNTIMGSTMENTVYIQGQRERREIGVMGRMNVVTILQCDKGREIELNLNNKTYIISPTYDISSSGADKNPAASADSAKKNKNDASKNNTDHAGRGGVVSLSLSSTDTGERQKLFGYTARHVKSSMSMDASPDACAKGNVKIENDGWYADLSPGLVCRPLVRPGGAGPVGGPSGECQDRYSFHNSGYANTGYPLKLTTSMEGSNRTFTFTTSQEVTELSRATLDPSLFEIPEGYTEAKSVNEFMGLSPQSPAETSSTATSVTKFPRKDPDIDRIGVPLVKKETSEKIDPAQARGYLIQTLKNADLDPVPVEGKTEAELEADARSKDCDYILYTDVTSVKGRSAGAKIGGFFGVSSGKPATFDVSLAYQLKKPGESKAILDSTEESREGATPGQGVGWALEEVVRATLNYIRQQ